MKETTLETNQGKQTYGAILNTLTYISYRYNRERSPKIAPKQWECVFGSKTQELEKIYQAEKEAI